MVKKHVCGCTPTQYWPHTALSVYRVFYFLVPHTHVLCMGSGSAIDNFYAARLVHSLRKYSFKFQLWYWIQIYTTKYSNLLLIILILVWIVCSTYRKGEILMQKWQSHQPICLLLHAILSGVGVWCTEIGVLFTEIILVAILNSTFRYETFRYEIFKFVIDNSDNSLDFVQHIQRC